MFRPQCRYCQSSNSVSMISHSLVPCPNQNVSTVTEVRKRRIVRGIIVAEHVMPVMRNVAPRDDDDVATTIFPTQTPEYATYCGSADEYYDACSSLGVT